MTGTAPYNFIPFGPVVPAHRLWRDPADNLHRRHDERVRGALSGYIDLRLQTLTPFHTGNDQQSTRVDEEGLSLLWPDRSNGVRAWIPGSSVRNGVRAVLDNVLGAAIDLGSTGSEPNDVAVHYRSPLPPGTGYTASYWRARGKAGLGVEQVGILAAGENRLYPGVRYKVDWAILLKDLGLDLWKARVPAHRTALMKKVRTTYQFQRVAATVGLAGEVTAIKMTSARKPEQWLLITGVGSGGNQHNAYVVEMGSSTSYYVPPEVEVAAGQGWSEYQVSCLPAQETWSNLQRIPVFYDASAPDATGKRSVTRIGFAGGFRIRAKHTLLDTIPKELRPRASQRSIADPSATSAIFGTVIEDPKAPYAIAARVSFGHGITDSLGAADSDWRGRFFESPQRVTPAPPHLTAVHLRLKQATSGIATFDGDQPIYRGRQVYLHRWDAAENGTPGTSWTTACQDHRRTAPRDQPLRADPHFGEQETLSNRVYRPLKMNIGFASRIFFHNLSSLELGALLYALSLADSQGSPGQESAHAHKLGGLRSLGLGSVALHADLHIELPPANGRYSSWGTMPSHESTLVQEYVARFIDFARRDLGVGAQLDAQERATRWRARLKREKTAEMDVATHQQRPALSTLEKLFPG